MIVEQTIIAKVERRGAHWLIENSGISTGGLRAPPQPAPAALINYMNGVDLIFEFVPLHIRLKVAY